LLLLTTLSTTPAGSEEIWFGDAIQTAVPKDPLDLAVGYLNQDGFLDVACYADDSDDGWVLVLFGDGTGHFTLNETYLAGEDGDDQGSIAIGDLNDDGAPDIATVYDDDSHCRIRYNDGFGGFSGSEDLLPYPGGGVGVCIGDLDDDTHNDLVVLSPYAAIDIFWGTEDGPQPESDWYVFMLSPLPGCYANWPKDCRLVDLTGDGRKDIVAIWNEYNAAPECGPDERGLSLLRNLGARQFGPDPEWLVREVLGADWHDFDAADLDNDEDLDVAISERSGYFLRTFLNSGDGQMVEGTAIELVGRYVALADLNGDENADIAWSQETVETNIWAGNGTDHFTFVETLGEPLRDVEAAEIDNHPGLDLIGFGDEVLIVFPNITYLDPSAVDEPMAGMTPSLMVSPTVLDAGGCVIRLSLDSDAEVPGLEILDVLGRRCATLRLGLAGRGTYSVRWSGTDEQGRKLPSGVYWIRPQGIRDVSASVLVLQ
jgi:hypothetical protein